MATDKLPLAHSRAISIQFRLRESPLGSIYDWTVRSPCQFGALVLIAYLSCALECGIHEIDRALAQFV